MKISTTTVNIIRTYSITLNELAYLYSLAYNLNWDLVLTVEGIDKLVRMRYLSDWGAITDEGISLLTLALPDLVETNTSLVTESRFEEFWKLYPEHDGVHRYVMTRKIKRDKAKAKSIYLSLLSSYTEEEIINGLKKAIDFTENLYFKQPGKNHFTYFKSPANFLDQRVFSEYTGDVEPTVYLNDDFI